MGTGTKGNKKSRRKPVASANGRGKSTYTGKDIQVLEGLDPVRKRPGMYIGGTGKSGLHHLLWEIVDNAVDEATNGYASQIDVVLHVDGSSATVTDNGRGIPVDLHPTKKIPTLELILTTLHSGGKFDGSNYITSGGLHGVGSSVVNALSEELVATVKRDGKTYEQRYARGKPKTKLKVLRKASRGTGTTIFFRPDTEIFGDVEFDPELIADQLEIKTFLNGNLRIVFRNERTGARNEFHHEGGITEYLDRVVESMKSKPVHPDPFIVKQETLESGARVEIALKWTEQPRETILSYVNGIPTSDGGTHEQGLKDAIRNAVRSYMDTHDMTPKGLDVSAEDVREGMIAILNVFMVDPQFQGQTKEKLNNTEARSLVAGTVRLDLEQFLIGRPTTGEAIATRVIQSARARAASRAAAKTARSKTSISHRLNLPGKLADCSSTDPEECELFIVEGDSAGGSAKQGRNRKFQAILPLRGKVLNAEQASLSKVQANKELANIVQALGCGVGDKIDLSRLRYRTIILLMDADSDGHHIATLLLTFIYRYLRPLIDAGFVYIAQPPLYRLDTSNETFWAIDDRHRDRLVKEIRKGRKDRKIDVQRFKGLGEMMPKTLNETTLNPTTRQLLQVRVSDEDRLATERTISELMGKDAAPRFEFIMQNAGQVEELDV